MEARYISKIFFFSHATHKKGALASSSTAALWGPCPHGLRELTYRPSMPRLADWLWGKMYKYPRSGKENAGCNKTKPLTDFFHKRKRVEQEAQTKPFRAAVLQKAWLFGQVAFGPPRQRGLLPPGGGGGGAAAKLASAPRARPQHLCRRESKKTCGLAIPTSRDFVFDTICLL